MPLQRRKPDYKQMIREHADDPATRTIHLLVDDDGGVQSDGVGGQVHQAQDVDLVAPPGYFCKPTADDEQIQLMCRGDWVIIAIKVKPPSDVSGARVREPVLWDPSGNRIRCNGSDGTEATVASGGKHKIRTDGADTQPLAYADASEGKASKISCNNAFEQFTDDLANDIAAIKADLTTALAFHSATPTLIPNHIVKIDEGDEIGWVKTGSSIGEVEQ